MYALTNSEPEEQEFIKCLTLLDRIIKKEEPSEEEINIKLTVGDLYCAMQTRDLSLALLFASENFDKLIDSPINLELFIRGIHLYGAKHLVMLSVAETPSGEYRSDNLGNAMGLDYKLVPTAMGEFCKTLFASLITSKTKEEIIEVGIFALTELCRIHPFGNGNGRTARMLMNCIFSHFGNCNPIVFPDTEKYNTLFDQYIKGNKALLETLIKQILAETPASTDLVTKPIEVVGFPTSNMKIYFHKTQGIGIVKNGEGLALDPNTIATLSELFIENKPVHNFLTKLAQWDWVKQSLDDWKNLWPLPLPNADNPASVSLEITTNLFFKNNPPSSWKPYPAKSITGNFIGHDMRFFKFKAKEDEALRNSFITHLEQQGFDVTRTVAKDIPCVQLDLTGSKPKI